MFFYNVFSACRIKFVSFYYRHAFYVYFPSVFFSKDKHLPHFAYKKHRKIQLKTEQAVVALARFIEFSENAA